jgi:hypothetical protein
MNPHNLPPLPPIDQLPAINATSTNPGVINPADQCFPAVKPEADQTQSMGSMSSASVTNSNGEIQRLDLKTPEVAATTGTGLATEVFAGSVNHSKVIPPQIAVATSPAIDVKAGNQTPGGLAANVMIR